MSRARQFRSSFVVTLALHAAGALALVIALAGAKSWLAVAPDDFARLDIQRADDTRETSAGGNDTFPVAARALSLPRQETASAESLPRVAARPVAPDLPATTLACPPAAAGDPTAPQALVAVEGMPGGGMGHGAGGGMGDGTGTVEEPVDEPPSLLSQSPRPVYPLGARQRGEEGRVELEIAVTAAGAVGAVRVARTSGFSDIDLAARDALREARFRPARRGADNVPATVRLAVVFRLTD
jgi:protein TonB